MATAATGTTFASDAFTDAAGTTLQAHDADWASTGLDDALITDDNRLRPGPLVAFGLYAYVNSGNAPPTANYDVRTDVIPDSLAGSGGVMARTLADISRYYYVWYNASAGAWELQKDDGSGGTLLGSYSQTLTADATYRLALLCNDGWKAVWIDGVERISVTDNAVTAANSAGVIGGTGGSPGNTTDVQLDNWEAQDFGAAAKAPPPLRPIRQYLRR